MSAKQSNLFRAWLAGKAQKPRCFRAPELIEKLVELGINLDDQQIDDTLAAEGWEYTGGSANVYTHDT
jgi:hypothetical protein